ncbi:MAG: hypothetical protein J5589_09775 [Firmicutes bacterium]|nr:hypothetical protein [Bacillota bacterium]
MNKYPTEWEHMSYKEKNRALFEKQVELLKEFLKKGVISQAQYDKSFHDLCEKTGYKPN